MPNFNDFVLEKNKAMLEAFGLKILEDIVDHDVYLEVEKTLAHQEERIRETIAQHAHVLEMIEANHTDYIKALASQEQNTFKDVNPDQEIIQLQSQIEECKKQHRENDALLRQNEKEGDNIPVNEKEPSPEVKSLREALAKATEQEKQAQDNLKQAEEELVLAQKQLDEQKQELNRRISDKDIESYSYNSQLLELQKQSQAAREELKTVQANRVTFEEEKDYNKAIHSKDDYYKNATLVYDQTERELERKINDADEKANTIIPKFELVNNELEELKKITTFPAEKNIAQAKLKIEEAKAQVQKASADVKEAKIKETQQLDKEENERLKRLDIVQKCYEKSESLDKTIAEYESRQNRIVEAKMAPFQKEIADLEIHGRVKAELNKEPLRTPEAIALGAKALKDVYDCFKQNHGLLARWFKGFKSFDVGKDYAKFSAMRERFIQASGISKEDINRYLDGKSLRNGLKEAIDSYNEGEKEASKDINRVPVNIDNKVVYGTLAQSNQLNPENGIKEKEIDAPINQK